SDITSDVSRPLAEVLQRAMSLDESKRFSSIKIFWEELKRAATVPDPVPIPTTPPPLEKQTTLPDKAKHAAKTRPARSWMLRVAILCALLLLLIGAGAWAWNITHSSAATITVQQGHTTPSATPAHLPPTPQPTDTGPHTMLDGYPDMRGVYNGHLVPLGAPYISFKLNIQQQTQNRISGTFTVPVYKDDHLKNATFTGTIDKSGTLQIAITGASGDLILQMSGGLNNSSPYTDSLGGTFTSCQAGSKTTCLPGGDPPSGPWTMERDQTS
ncbi:MAG TPA: hypothetical protein VFN35_24610, partial [Ktedonobacteraceae bacterium]|nr:hypothetical protein [Ktedonobacteraceae bacterium]